MRTRGQVAGVAVVVGLVAVGCGNIAERAAEEVVERAAENAGGGDVDVDFNNGEFDVEGDDFSMDQEMGRLPDGWPGEVPMPGQLVVQNGLAFEDDNGQAFSAVGEWQGDCDNDFLGFLAGLPSEWEPLQDGASQLDCGGGFLTSIVANGTWTVTYALIGERGEWNAQVQVFADASGGGSSGG